MAKNEKLNPKVKDVLKILGTGTFLAAGLVMPHLAAIGLKEYRNYKKEKDAKEWKKFNLWRLRAVIKRLERQKMIEVKDGEVQVTEKGKQKVLRFNMEEMELPRKTDGKWRLIIYDISDLRRKERDFFRSFLKRLNFLKLQESIYLTPFVCEDEIEFLKQQFGVGREVQVLKVIGIENEKEYKDYFGI